MNTAVIIIIICAVFLLSYFFDITSKFTRVPSVILLMGVGFGIAQLSSKFGIELVDFNSVLPILGTFGLILIVLDESFDLELSKERIPIMRKSLIVAVFPMLILCGLFAWGFFYFQSVSWHSAVVNAIPMAIISSAIAIPSVHLLSKSLKEFVVYESSLSDIFGVVLFNFFALNEVFNGATFLHFGFQLILMLVISFVASILLSVLLSKIDHHIKFAPIVVLVILIYELAKIYHLPSLIFILLFGIFLGNLDLIKNEKFKALLHPEIMDREVKNFRKIVAEGTFLMRTLFFVVFGYLIDMQELINPSTMQWSVAIVVAIFVVRAIQLKAIGLPVFPLVFVAPRGLITILLFLSIPTVFSMELVNNSMIIQVIIITVLIMMIGMLFYKAPVKVEALEEEASFFPKKVIEEALGDNNEEDLSTIIEE